jgi:hypothetical protein
MPATRPWAQPTPPRARRGRAARCLAALVALAFPSLIASAAEEQQGAAAPGDGVTIAILDLREIPELAPKPQPEERRPAWRTTFGSERETQPEIKSAIGSAALAPVAGVDAVLIQGVKASAPLRRLFPPRDWRLVVSRRVLSPTDPVGFRTVRSDLPFTTAIAVKARKDLRITARAFALALDGMERHREPDQSDPAATAVRLVDAGGRTFWLASIALPASCGAEDPPCPAFGRLDAWREEKLKAGEPTLIGGRMTARAAPHAENSGGKEATCTSHTVESDLAWERVALEDGENSSEVGTGCISIVRLAR